MKVAVISGGFSEEQHASRDSAQSVAKALEELGHTAFMVEYDRDFPNKLINLSPDAVFPIVQGKYHGDGAVQAVLELIGIPYVGSRPPAAAIINHKTLCKRIWMSAGVSTPEFFEFDRKEYINCGFDEFKHKAAGFDLPFVAKPPSQGGRYGMAFIRDEESYKALAPSFDYDETLLIERYVPGRFITQAIIEIDGKMTTLPPVEVIDDSDTEFKLYTGKYIDLRFIPASELEPELVREISKTSLYAAALVGASSHARLDYHYSGGKLYLLEINAVPGLIRGFSHMTKCSGFAGYEYPALVKMILDTAR